MAAAQLSRQAIQFLGSVALARLLTPEQFGITAIVWTFIGFATLFSDLGLVSAIVQARRVSDALLATAFWFNAASGVALSIVVASLGIPLAHLYDRPVLAPLLAVSGLSFALSLNAVPTALLQRVGRFSTLAIVETTGAAVGTAVMVVLAATGSGIYSLVIGPIVTTVIVSVGGLAASRYVPRGRPTRHAARELWAFGSGLAAFNFLAYWSRNFDNLLIGKFVGPAELGLYSRAYNLMMLPISQIGPVLNRVLFPKFSRMQDDLPALVTVWLRNTRLAMAAATPIAVGLAVTAPDFVVAMYGPRWADAAPLLTILALSAPPQIFAATLGAVYQGLGWTRALARRGLYATGITVSGVSIGLIWGATGVCVGLAVAVFASIGVNLPYVLRRLEVSPRELVPTFRGPLVGSLALSAGVLAVRHLVHVQVGWALAIEVLTGAVLYGAGLYWSDKDAALTIAGPLLRRLPWAKSD